MSIQSWQETLAAQQAAGTLQNTYTTAKSVINPQALAVLPAGFWVPGKMLKVTAQGAISNRVTGPDTTTFQIMAGAAGTTVVWTSGAVNLTTTSHVTIPFWLEVILTCRTVGNGTTATLMGQGQIQGIMFAQTANQADLTAAGISSLLLPNTAPAVGAGFDSTVANIIDFWVAQSVSNVLNGIQIHQYKVESLN